ncbi:MAG: glycosyltransferase family 39 protein [Acidobacteria bacterium]|nr:glycosyltransferase family 39 protein [Acidobacteriota bacterium]
MRRIEVALAVALTVLAGALRFRHLESIPYGLWFDEAVIGLQAREALATSRLPLFAHHVSGLLVGLYALSLKILSNDVFGLRAVSALFGTLAVPLAWLVGRRLAGPRAGLLFAALLATSRWHLNFSRIAMTGVDVTFFSLALVYALLRLEETPRARWAVAAGLALGGGLSCYAAFRLIAFGLFALIAARAISAKRLPPWRPVLVTAGTALLVLAPVLVFAAREPATYFGRLSEVSLLEARQEPDLGKALVSNVRYHLGMFHVEGDWNGRHNVPGEPMLGRIAGALLLAGLVLGGRRRVVPAVVLLGAGLLAGILTADWEAPQALRSIGALAPALFLAALGLDALAARLPLAGIPKGSRSGPTGPPGIPKGFQSSCAAIVLLVSGTLEVRTYFTRQVRIPEVFEKFSTAESAVGREMREARGLVGFVTSPLVAPGESARFLAGDLAEADLLDPGAFPVSGPRDRPVKVYLDGSERAERERLFAVYPNARLFAYSAPAAEPGDPPFLYRADLSPRDLASPREAPGGFRARYFASGRFEGSPAVERVEPFLDRRVHAVPFERPYAVEWSGLFTRPEVGEGAFCLAARGHATLHVDGQGLVSARTPGDPACAPFAFDGKPHRLVVRFVDDDRYSRIHAWWIPPGGRRTVLAAPGVVPPAD